MIGGIEGIIEGYKKVTEASDTAATAQLRLSTLMMHNKGTTKEQVKAVTTGLRSSCPQVVGIADVAAAVEVNSAGVLTLDGGRWLPAYVYPSDGLGIHPNEPGHEAMATQLNLSLLTAGLQGTMVYPGFSLASREQLELARNNYAFAF